MTEFVITGTFEAIYDDEFDSEENALMQVMDNYLAGVKDDCDDWFKDIKFEFMDINVKK